MGLSVAQFQCQQPAGASIIMEDQQPKVYTPPNTEVKPGNQWFKSWRIIYPILGLVLIVEIIWGFKTLLTPLPKPLAQKLQPIKGAAILLITHSNKTIYKVGETIPVVVRVSTGGHATSGTDLILHFNPKILEASQTAFVKGEIYTDFPLINVDGKLGIIKVSGAAPTLKKGFNGGGDLGVINFKAKATGTTTLTIDFKKGQTNESNVMEVTESKNVLEKVESLQITVQ